MKCENRWNKFWGHVGQGKPYYEVGWEEGVGVGEGGGVEENIMNDGIEFFS